MQKTKTVLKNGWIWNVVELKTFSDEMKAEAWMVDNCLENGFYRSVNGKFVVFEYQFAGEGSSRPW